MNKKITSTRVLAVLMAAIIISSLIASATRVNQTRQLAATSAELKAVVTERKELETPQLVEGNWTFFQYQYGSTNIYYSTQHYYEGNKLFIRDRETGYIFPIVFDDNVSPVPGWIEDEELLAKYGVYIFTDEEYYGLQKE